MIATLVKIEQLQAAIRDYLAAYDAAHVAMATPGLMHTFPELDAVLETQRHALAALREVVS